MDVRQPAQKGLKRERHHLLQACLGPRVVVLAGFLKTLTPNHLLKVSVRKSL